MAHASAVCRPLVSPTIIEDFALVLDWAGAQKAQGIYHATCGTKDQRL